MIQKIMAHIKDIPMESCFSIGMFFFAPAFISTGANLLYTQYYFLKYLLYRPSKPLP